MSDTRHDAHRTISLLSPAVGTGNVGDHFIEAAVRRLLDPQTSFRRFTIRRPLTRDEIDAINGTRWALVCGTNLYQAEWESALTPEVLEQIEVPVIPFGVGGSAAERGDTHIGPATRRMIQALHARCAAGSVRDPHAAEVVARAGVRNAVLTGCPVLHWARRDDLPAAEPGPQRRLVVTARNWLMHRWPENIDHPVQINFLRRVLSHLAGREWIFAVHEELDRRLVERLGVPSDRVFESGESQDYVALYTEPGNLVLALRLHAGMLALASGVPAVFVGHDTRTYSFCEMLGIGYVPLFAADAPERCIEELQRQWHAPPPPASAQNVYRRLRQAMAEFLAANGLPAHRDTPAAAGTQASWV